MFTSTRISVPETTPNIPINQSEQKHTRMRPDKKRTQSQLVIRDIRKNKLRVSESDKLEFLAAEPQMETTIFNPRPTLVSDNYQISQDLAPKPKLSEINFNKELGGKSEQDTRLADI